MNYIQKISSILINKKILILGFGKEGRSSFNFLSSLDIPFFMTISDANEGNREEVEKMVGGKAKCKLGTNYLDDLAEYDIILKSPGLPLSLIEGKVDLEKVSSQTNLFLQVFRDQVIGVTGTKGKSTTSTLIYKLLYQSDKDVLLVGNIGKPAFDYFNQINEHTIVVFEMSSHQLELLRISPHIALLLNLYEEHLDHYANLRAYHDAKWNIAKYQQEGDYLLYNSDDVRLAERVEGCNSKSQRISVKMQNLASYTNFFEALDNRILDGDHNKMNILFLLEIAKYFSINEQKVLEVLNDFEGLPHRLQYFGTFNGILFYDDSISTIPEASMMAINALGNVETLILGGKDRGINYDSLPSFIEDSSVRTLILVGETTLRLANLMEHLAGQIKIVKVKSYDEIAEIVFSNTKSAKSCLLSPAAASYDMFKSFEERGDYFQRIIKNYADKVE